MKKILINYSDHLYRDAQKLNAKTGLEAGGFDEVICYSPKDIDAAFFERNKEILTQKRGNGYWLWKPYLIARTLEGMQEGDILFYCDAGAYFTGSVNVLVEVCERDGQDIILFELSNIEKHWTKRDAFVLMDCDLPEYADTRQRLASFSLWKKSDFTMQFIGEYLRYAEDPRIITDMPNEMGLPDYEGFQSHRHDQSIFSLLSKKHGLKAYKDPCQYGNNKAGWYTNSPYGQLINHTRKKNKSFISRVKARLAKLINAR